MSLTILLTLHEEEIHKDIAEAIKDNFVTALIALLPNTRYKHLPCGFSCRGTIYEPVPEPASRKYDRLHSLRKRYKRKGWKYEVSAVNRYIEELEKQNPHLKRRGPKPYKWNR